MNPFQHGDGLLDITSAALSVAKIRRQICCMHVDHSMRRSKFSNNPCKNEKQAKALNDHEAVALAVRAGADLKNLAAVEVPFDSVLALQSVADQNGSPGSAVAAVYRHWIRDGSNNSTVLAHKAVDDSA